MPKWNNQTAVAQQVDVLLFDDFSGLCLANTVEPMRAANQLAGRKVYRWRYLGVDRGVVTSSSGMQVSVDLPDGSGDMLVIMPSYGFERYTSPRVMRIIQAAAKRYARLAGFDMGGWLLAHAGLLDGRCATVHWEELDRFAEAYPYVDVRRERIVTDRDILTCSGAQAAFDLMLDLIAQHHGAAMRIELAALFMTPEGTTPQDVPMAQSRPVERAIRLMQEHTEHPLTIAEVARRSGRHQKDLERRMAAELGASPVQVYRRLRLLAARKILREQTIPITEVALRAGYQNASAMTRAYRQEFGLTPREERNR